jgi:hypothetical protein
MSLILIKLNGTVGLVSSSEQEIGYVIPHCYFQPNSFDQRDFASFVEKFKHLSTQNSQPLLSFAWEIDLGNKIIMNEAILATQRTKTLVIIGYSFPYFNRAIDRSLFDGMHYLSKIYIQDPNAGNMIQMVDELVNHLPARNKVEIVPFIDASQFLIPNELI